MAHRFKLIFRCWADSDLGVEAFEQQLSRVMQLESSRSSLSVAVDQSSVSTTAIRGRRYLMLDQDPRAFTSDFKTIVFLTCTWQSSINFEFRAHNVWHLGPFYVLHFLFVCRRCNLIPSSVVLISSEEILFRKHRLLSAPCPGSSQRDVS